MTLPWGNTLVMEAGSKLTNYTQKGSVNYDLTAVTVRGGVFELRGGEPSNITGRGNLVLCYEANSGIPAGQFIYDGGVFSGNTGDTIAIGTYHNPTLYEVDDSRFAPEP
ncbi:MAG: hypothetical protein LBF95_02405 [Treponema sp.]|jgi:hypothetical protein|nr:hypothetical protein [Treponema sp.]